MLLLWIIYVISVLFLLCFRVRLFIDALWSPAGKGLTSWLSFVMTNCEVVTFLLVFWVRCGSLLYWFLIFALFLTLVSAWLLLVSKLSCEIVGGLEPNLHGYNVGARRRLNRGWQWLLFLITLSQAELNKRNRACIGCMVRGHLFLWLVMSCLMHFSFDGPLCILSGYMLKFSINP